jgi:valyl-tRNA synthetase
MITGFDILFFWVARMIMLGLECTGDVPFREVYIHALVRDAERQKMSKTKGNVVDPLLVTEKYGTDAVRMAFLRAAAPGTDIVFTDERMESARNFANKIWNAARLIFMNMERSGITAWAPSPEAALLPEFNSPGLEAPLEDRWIFSRLNQCADLMNRAIDRYRFHEAAELVWQFFWHEFCDWYLEVKKLRLEPDSGLTTDWRNLLTVFEAALRLLHPIMPFLTEELWQRLLANAGERPVSIAVAPYPEYDAHAADHAAERDMQILQDIVVMVRNLRADFALDPKQEFDAVLVSSGAAAELARAQLGVIQGFAKVTLDVRADANGVAGVKRSAAGFDLVLSVPAAQTEILRKRMEKENEQLEKNIANSTRQLGDQTFLARAPAQVVDSIRQKLAGYESQLEKNRATLNGLS